MCWSAGASAQTTVPAKPAGTSAPAEGPTAPPPPDQPAVADAPAGSPEAQAADAARASGVALLRLDEAIQRALANNERARKAPLRVRTAEGQLERARSAFLPSLATGAAGVWRGTEDRSGNNVTTSGTVTLTQPLFAPSAIPQYQQSSHQLEAEKANAHQDRRVLAFDTARSFLQVLTAERVYEAALRRLDRAKANLQNAEARAQAQLASTNDATRARLELATSAREVAQGEGNLQRTYLQLGFLVGERVEGRLAAPDRTTASAEAFENTPADQVKLALDRRPDVRAARERTESLRASAREPMWRLAPTLNAQGQMRILPNAQAGDSAVDETVTLNLNWTIFDAGARYADRKTRLAQADSQALDESLLRRSVGVDVESAMVTLRTAREAYRIANEALTSAQKNVEETEILYRQGLARALEVTDANGKRFDAEVSRATAKLQMEQAYLELRFSLGLGPVDDDIPTAGGR